MFETFIVQPILNVLLIIYALIPGHDFGVAVLLFTILVRFALWPLLRKQLHQTRKIRELQPEIKKIKAKSKGDRQKEGQLLMELYKERGVSPFGSIGILFLQLPILIGLFQGLRRLANDANTVIDISYDWVKDLGYMKDVVADISNFDESLLGIVDLTRSAFGDMGTYMPALILAVLAAIFQFYQSKSMQPDTKDKKTLRQILKSEASGDKVDQADINAAMGRNMRYFFPAITFLFASRVPGALALYWAAGSFIGIIQQRTVLQQDVEEMEVIADVNKSSSKKDLTRKPKYPKNKKTSAKTKGG